MNAFWTYVRANWKTNLGAVAAFLMSVPADVTAFQQWQNHQPVDWHFAAAATVLAFVAAVAKDASNHSTQAQVAQATAEKTAR